ncbi:uncharacterized protein LOC125442481 [Sphaerodactylus townsendi]|uniref:uncharacterized protein LOC125442481 n=1 Tax=Sphaerodactylus townsendi TaxID=933632 RepID=UPI0020262F8C|nr:uncharacterized protein LOC125442481 [Sphaerodactylus townsendi]
MNGLQWKLELTLSNCVTNEGIRQELEIIPITKKTREARLRWPPRRVYSEIAASLFRIPVAPLCKSARQPPFLAFCSLLLRASTRRKNPCRIPPAGLPREHAWDAGPANTEAAAAAASPTRISATPRLSSKAAARAGFGSGLFCLGWGSLEGKPAGHQRRQPAAAAAFLELRFETAALGSCFWQWRGDERARRPDVFQESRPRWQALRPRKAPSSRHAWVSGASPPSQRASNARLPPGKSATSRRALAVGGKAKGAAPTSGRGGKCPGFVSTVGEEARAR